MARGPYPEAMLGWVLQSESAAHAARFRLLDVGTGRGGLARMITAAEPVNLTCLDQDRQRLVRLQSDLPATQMIVGKVENLPFDACRFDLVTAAQNLHRFAPQIALPEIARVLVPGGHFVAIYNTRDDTVPWVRRLIKLLQEVDPQAMIGDYGVESVEQLIDSEFFSTVDRNDFRNWIPIDRDALINMVAARPGTQQLPADERELLLADVGALYNSYARIPDPLMLPFRTSCWRALVDHTELTMIDPIDALQIAIGY